MNYDQRFAQLIADVKADKSVTQPWRNKAIGRLDEAQALLEKGQRMTNLQPPAGFGPDIGGPVVTCMCLPGTRNKSCPTHGDRS